MASKNKHEPIRLGLGVLTGGPAPVIVDSVYKQGSNVVTVTPTGESEMFKATNLNIEQNSGRIVFTAQRALRHVRDLRETDGQWMSRFKVDLPIEALESIAYGEITMNEESITAFASEDSPYVLGVTYSTGENEWVRTDGDWLLLAEDDATYANMEPIHIDADRAEEFLDLYDHNYVTVSDAQQYESAESAEVTPTSAG